MKLLRFRLVQVATVATASIITLSGVAHADGLKSQWKTRMPFSAGLVKVQKQLWKPSSPEPKVLKTQSKYEAVPRLYVQRKGRLQSRVLKNRAGKEVKTQTVAKQTPVFGEIDKIRSIKRTMKPANKCAVLHTHEKARCQRDLTYRKTNQYRTHVAGETPVIVVADSR